MWTLKIEGAGGAAQAGGKKVFNSSVEIVIKQNEY